MNIEIRELAKVEEFPQAEILQKELGRVPVTISLLYQLTGHPKAGMVIGAFERNNLIGLLFSFITEDKNLYMGDFLVSLKYQNQGIGQKILEYFSKVARGSGYKKVYFTFDPSDAKLAYLYHKRGVRLKEFIQDYYGELNEPFAKGSNTDRILVEWELEKNINKTINIDILPEHIPVIHKPQDVRNNTVVTEIPADIYKIKAEDVNKANEHKEKLRVVFNHCLDSGYYPHRVIHEKENNRYFYLFSKKELGDDFKLT